MFTPHPPRPRIPKTAMPKAGIARPPAFGILRDNASAFEKPVTAGDTQNQAAFKPLPVK